MARSTPRTRRAAGTRTMSDVLRHAFRPPTEQQKRADAEYVAAGGLHKVRHGAAHLANAARHLVKKHWRGIAKIAIAAGAIAGGAACTASVVCGVGVGLVAGFASYSAGNAGTNDFSIMTAVEQTVVGGALGGLGSVGTGLVDSGTEGVQSVVSAGLRNALFHPLQTTGALGTAYAQLGAGYAIKGSDGAASLICDYIGCPPG